MQRDPREDERLGLSRRSFFFFGAILAAKPEIVVPKTWRFKTPLMPVPPATIQLMRSFQLSIDSLMVMENEALFYRGYGKIVIAGGQHEQQG